MAVVNDGSSDDSLRSARFKNVGKLFSDEVRAVENLTAARVCIIGLGGVGSWVGEALARSGIGHFTLFDLDDVCVSNTNRQIIALTSTIGKFKADVLRDRILDINPEASVDVVYDFVRPSNAVKYITANTSLPEEIEAIRIEQLRLRFFRKFDFVIDAADGVSDKAAIIHACVLSETPVITSGGVGGLLDPSLITTSDLTKVAGDNLLMRVRKKLRQEYGYPKVLSNTKRVKPWNIMAVHTLPTGLRRDNAHRDSLSIEDEISATDAVCELDSGKETGFRKCDGVLGNACFVTGSVGFIIAGAVVRHIASGKTEVPYVFRGKQSLDYEQKSLDKENTLTIKPATKDISTSVECVTCCQNPANDDKRVKIFDDSTSTVTTLLASFQDFTEPLIDAHCHLQADAVYFTAKETILLAKKHGISHASVCATIPGEDWRRVLELYQAFPQEVVPSFGLHPWFINRYIQSLETTPGSSSNEAIDQQNFPSLLGWSKDLEQLLIDFPLAGVGECGLDKAVKKDVSIERQNEILVEHLRLASRYHRVISIHCVGGCWGTLLQTLQQQLALAIESEDRKSRKPSASIAPAEWPMSIILHSCNSMPLDMVQNFTKIPNMYYSISGRALDNDKAIKLLKSLPSDRLLIETDSPDQLPLKLREKLEKNTVALLRYNAFFLAKEMKIRPSEFALMTNNNARRALGIP